MFFKDIKKQFPLASKNKSAFNFIELAIVIVIIGVLVSAVLAGSGIIKKSRLATARNLTKNAPVNVVDGLFAWYEPTLSNSFLESETEEGVSVSEWNDIKLSGAAIDATQSNTSDKPEFSGKINYLSTVKFDGTGKYFNVDATNLNNADYTIIVVEKRSSGDSDNYFIGDSSITTDDENILLGYSSSGEVTHSQGGSNSYTSSVSGYANSDGDTRVFTFMQKSSSGKETYINGYLAGNSADTSKVSNLTNLVIGKDYNGEIGEVIIFNKALSNKERRNIEEYLGQKWSVEITDSSTSCANGIVTSSGCEIACSVSIDGVSTPTSVAANSSGSFTCDTPEYNDTISYTCSNDGSLDIGSEICDVCGSGYSFYNSVCQGPCLTSGITGVTDGTSVDAGANSATCNDTGYTGTITGICDGGTFTADSGQACECDTGYTPNGSGSCVGACTGGTITTYTDGEGVVHTVHTFTTVGSAQTFECPNDRDIDILVVGGGGRGSEYYDGGGGGGGGGVVYATSLAVSASNTYAITVGSGGATNTGCYGVNGGDSKFNDGTADIIVAKGGGGGGGGGGGTCGKGVAGGSGGGGGRDSGSSSGGGTIANIAPAGAASYGSSGGNSGGSWSGGGGGGGANQVGGNGSGGSAGAERSGSGGDGVQISISGISPTPCYGSGGGGGVNGSSYVSAGGCSTLVGAGGSGGARGYTNTGTPRSSAATNGANGYGSGGGGSHPVAPGSPGSGGSGTVIISY